MKYVNDRNKAVPQPDNDRATRNKRYAEQEYLLYVSESQTVMFAQDYYESEGQSVKSTQSMGYYGA